MRLLSICIAFVWTAAARDAAASDLVLEWKAPAGCPSKADMASRAERFLDHAGLQTDLSVNANVTRVLGSYRVVVLIQSSRGSGERVLEDSSCEILADSVALVIALSSSAAEGSRPQALTLSLSAHATALSGALPAIGFGGGGALALEGLASLRFELGASYYAQQSDTYPQTQAGAQFQLVRVGARGCRVWGLGPVDLAPCLGAQIYRLTGTGFGGVKSDSGTIYAWGPALGFFARLRLLSFFGVVFGGDATIPVTRQRFVYSDRGLLHQPAALALQLFLAPEVQF